ncbi:hypothetical protein ES707_03361 [subsurface metagenome]
MKKEMKKLPKPSAGDSLHTAIKAGLSAIPGLGGPAAELFNNVIIPPLAKRRNEWLNSLAEALNELQKKIDGFKINELVSNDTFLSFLMQATQVAIRNHQKEKLKFLRDAVLNIAIQPPNEHIESVLVSFLDIATPWHIKILKFYSNPKAEVEKANIKLESGDHLSHLVSKVFPELEKKEAFRLQVERDLLHYGLILPESAWYTERTTNSGDELLKYLIDPINEKA